MSIIYRVGCGYYSYIRAKYYRICSCSEFAFLEDAQKCDLLSWVKNWKLIYAQYAMAGLEQLSCRVRVNAVQLDAFFCYLDGVYLSYKILNRDIGRRKYVLVSIMTFDPVNFGIEFIVPYGLFALF